MALHELAQALCHVRGKAYLFLGTGIISNDTIPPPQLQQEPSTVFAEPCQSPWTSSLVIFSVLPL